MSCRAIGQPSRRCATWVVDADGIDAATGQHRPRQLGQLGPRVRMVATAVALSALAACDAGDASPGAESSVPSSASPIRETSTRGDDVVVASRVVHELLAADENVVGSTVCTELLSRSALDVLSHAWWSGAVELATTGPAQVASPEWTPALVCDFSPAIIVVADHDLQIDAADDFGATVVAQTDMGAGQLVVARGEIADGPATCVHWLAQVDLTVLVSVDGPTTACDEGALPSAERAIGAVIESLSDESHD